MKPIAIDFDGTIVEHMFPGIGSPVPGAIKWLKLFKEAGAVLILWTMRSDGIPAYTKFLTAAVEFCRKHGVEFDFVNENPQDWTNSPKAYAVRYVDDAAAGCPLIYPGGGRRPYVDWEKVGPMVMEVLTQ